MNNINEELKNFRQNVNENLHKILKLDLLTENLVCDEIIFLLEMSSKELNNLKTLNELIENSIIIEEIEKINIDYLKSFKVMSFVINFKLKMTNDSVTLYLNKIANDLNMIKMSILDDENEMFTKH